MLTLLDLGAGLLALALILRFLTRKRTPPFPPGPKGLPLLGNALDMPSTHEWLTFARWHKRWGDLISVDVFGQRYLILGAARHGTELLERRSALYSCRPVIPVGGEMVGWKRTLVLQPYGPSFREYRRVIQQHIGTRTLMERYHPLIAAKTRDLVVGIAREPGGLVHHLQRAAGAIILMIGYGYTPQEGDDPFVRTVDTVMEQFALCTSPGAFLANIFPILRHVPDWLPGTAWKQTAREWGKLFTRMCESPVDFVKEQMAAGTAIPSLVSSNLEGGVTPEQEELVTSIAASLYSAGADTTVSSLNAFFLCMLLNPDVLHKAQAEIDAVVGNDRMPTWEDREQLPYVNAVYLEAMRWHTVTPLGIPHRLIEDDVYEGYFIPKGTVVIQNTWAMAHDERLYPDSMSFNPERFITSPGHEPEKDPREITFGYGRRICPGLLLADLAVWLGVAQSLAVFDISKPVENGIPVEPVLEVTTGTISHPVPYKVEIKPRSAKAEALILSESTRRFD